MQDILLHYIPSFLLVLGIVVFVHEWGHYIVAKMCGVKIESFSIGFGPELCGFNDKSGTRWKLSLLPFGGYVKMFGDEDPSSAKPSDKVLNLTESEKKVAFYNKPVWQRALIVFAGPAINFIFTFIVFVALFVSQGQPFTPPKVGSVAEGTPAFEAGLIPGDTVTKINNVKIERFEDIRREISTSVDESVNVVIERDGKTITKIVHPRITEVTDRFGGTHKVSQIGIKAVEGKMNYRKLSFFPAIGVAVNEMGSMAGTTLKAIGQIIVGTRGTEDLGGPLRIAQMSGKVGQEGIVPLIWFMAVISLSLGLFNLFPIPLLDGGHLFFYACEAIKGKPLNESITELSSKAGFVFIIGLTLFFTWNDLVQLHVFSFVKGLFT